MKPIHVKSSTYIDFGVESNDVDPKFKVGDDVRISKYKNIFAKGCTRNWSEEVLFIKKVKNTLLWTYFISDLMVKKFLERFLKKDCKKQTKHSFELKR